LSVHVPPPLKVPLSLVNVTVPVGVVPPAPAVSVTVAVHVVAPFTGMVPGVQLTLVLVPCGPRRYVIVTSSTDGV
jgi:hypothetical protein